MAKNESVPGSSTKRKASASEIYEAYKARHGDMLQAMGRVD